MALTVTAVRNTKPEKKPLRLYDSDGMYLEITPAGGRWWRLAYRFGGKRKLLSLGTFPDVTLPEARERRDDARKLIAKKIDPSAQRKAEKGDQKVRNANSFEAVAREWYGRHSPTWVATHSTDVLRRLEGNLFDEIGDKPVAEITAPVLLAAIRKIEARGAHDLAHRVLGVAGQVFRYAVATGRCERDPSGDLRGALTPHKRRNQAAVTAEELPDLLRKIAAYGEIGDKLTAAALRLLALTFVRTGELVGATWDEIDIESAVWIVPPTRMKMGNEHVVPLSRQAIEVLKAIPRIDGSRYVFPGRDPDKPMSNNTMLFALYRLGYKHKMTGHGFRAVASTMLNEAGFRPDVIERQLAHVERNAVRAAYHRAEYLQERQAMMQQWADMLDALAQGAQVIPLQRRTK
jgi:integrase